MNSEKYALLIFPGLMNYKALKAMVTEQGIIVPTRRDPVRYIIKGSKLITPSTLYCMVRKDEIESVLDEFSMTDANLFIVPWSLDMAYGLNEHEIKTIIIQPMPNTQYRYVGKAYEDNAPMDTVMELKNAWVQSISLPIKFKAFVTKLSMPITSISSFRRIMGKIINNLPD